jgi:hypothetical protein
MQQKPRHGDDRQGNRDERQNVVSRPKQLRFARNRLCELAHIDCATRLTKSAEGVRWRTLVATEFRVSLLSGSGTDRRTMPGFALDPRFPP